MIMILASSSKNRSLLLNSVHVGHEVIPPRIDEDEIKASLLAEGMSVRDMADHLAEAKSMQVSRQYPAQLVLGADQILDVDGQMLSKASSLEEARDHLRLISGKQHQLITAMVVSDNGSPVWRHVAVNKLWVRPLSEEFLDFYMNHAGDELTASVGCYAYEGLGRGLFWKVEGEQSSIQGLSLLPLLDFLRIRGKIPK